MSENRSFQFPAPKHRKIIISQENNCEKFFVVFSEQRALFLPDLIPRNGKIFCLKQ